MKINKTIYKHNNENIFNIQEIKYTFEGKILYMTTSENNNMFILTDYGDFYVIEKGIEKYIKKYKISSVPSTNKKYRKYQTENKHSQIWCDKLGNHVIFKYKDNLYYYNPNIPKEKIQELNIYNNNYYILPYAIGFNNDFYDQKDTGDILFSDFNSDIYQLRIQVNDKNKIRVFFFRIFSFKPQFQIMSKEDFEEDNEDDEEDFSNLILFKLEENEVILDMKIIFSFENTDIYDTNLNNERKNILIIAITKNKLFQFYGKDSYEKVFQNYGIENSEILQAYKLFHSRKNYNLNKSRIQLFNQYLPFYNFDTFKKPQLLFSCMYQCGYCIGTFKDSLNPFPTKDFIIYNYPKVKNKNTLPLVVAQSIIHIFYLYDDFLIIKNKLTNRIANTIFLKEKMLDIYYNIVMNEIILYSENNIYKISLDLENRYLWEYYIENGNYKYALQTLTKEDKYMKPILHKLYANFLFDQKQYLDAAKQYAFSDEKFEHVCLKFLSLNNIESLLQYLSLVYYYKNKKKRKHKNQNENHKIKDDNNQDNFIEKYLINTWIFELLIIKKEEYKNDDMVPFIRDYTRNAIHGKDYIDQNILYFVFNCHSKYEELIEYAKINQDYEIVIFTLINRGNAGEALEYIKILFYFGIDNINNIMKKMFYKYGNLFMKINPKESINILDNYFKMYENPIEIIRILLSFNFKKNASDDDTLRTIINYIKHLLISNFGTNESKIKTLYHLLILFLSLFLINNKKNINELINYLNILINQNHKNYFDFNFTKIIFKNRPSIVSMIYYVFCDYNKFVRMSLDNNFNNNLKIIFYNIKNNNIKSEILHNIIRYKKEKNIFDIKKDNNNDDTKNIINDFILQITDNLKVNIFNDELTYKTIMDLLLC